MQIDKVIIAIGDKSETLRLKKSINLENHIANIGYNKDMKALFIIDRKSPFSNKGDKFRTLDKPKPRPGNTINEGLKFKSTERKGSNGKKFNKNKTG